MFIPIRFFFPAILLLFTATSFAELKLHVLDTGPGLATITEMPNGDIMVYDTGHWNPQKKLTKRMSSIIGDRDIDLLVLSHSDGDHVSGTDELFKKHRVQRVIRTGKQRPNKVNWERADEIIKDHAAIGLTHDINLRTVALPHGTTYQYGDVSIQLLSGFHEPPSEWGLSGGEFLNGNSIVLRLSYKGKHVLFTGDAVGRVEGSSNNSDPIATEKYLIANKADRPIDSDVMFAPHHGGDDGSALKFIKEVSPTWVIFSAGHQYRHPHKTTAQRYKSAGVDESCMLRTDFGDDEGSDEWSKGRINGHKDKSLDDDLTISIDLNGVITTRTSNGVPINCQGN